MRLALPRPQDDWNKPRSHGQHLSEADHAVVRQGFRAGRTAKEVARELKCASRTINIHYGLLRAEGSTRRQIKPAPARTKIDKESRFYKSSFEPA